MALAITSPRSRLLGKNGSDSVSAAYYSIHPEFVHASYKLLNEHAGVEDAIKGGAAVSNGLKKYAPDICEELAPDEGCRKVTPNIRRVLYAATRHRRLDDPLIDAWLAVNCIREWRRYPLGDANS